ncbi:MAG TPA: phage/plasmid replication protein [Pyrinomonadaceae bacterium]|jgi:hypothetical protein
MTHKLLTVKEVSEILDLKTLNGKGSDYLPNLTMIKTPNGIWHLSAEVSLPKMLFGHNARLPNQMEVSEGLKMIAEYVEANSGQHFDAKTAMVSRIDFAKDFPLSEAKVFQVIKKLSDKILPRMEKLLYNDSTLYFKAKSRQIRIYGKFREVLATKQVKAKNIKTAKGILRFEHSYFKSYAIDSIVEKLSLRNKTTQSLLTQDVSDFVMSEVLENLNFYELITNDKTNLENLLETFPTKKTMNFCAFLEMLKLRGELFYKDESLGFFKDSYFRDAKECRKAKVWKQSKSLE